MSEYARESSGPGVDSKGNPVIDPTKNVLDLVSAQQKAARDLLDLSLQRQDDLREASAFHSREMAALRANYEDRLRKAESDRLDSIRAIDVGAVQQAATVQEARATALANQVAASAEAMRTQVAAAAAAAATSLSAALVPLTEAIADLRRAQYEAQGQKTQVVEQRGSIGTTAAILGSIAGFLLFLVTVVTLYTSLHKSTPPTNITVTTPTTQTATTP